MVVGIADGLELYLLPALQALFHQDLRCEGKCRFGQLAECLLIGTDAATQTAEGVGRADHDGEANLVGGLQGIVHVLHSVADGHLQVNLAQLLHEEVAVLGVHDGLDASAKHLDAILLEHARLIQLRATVQGRLSAKSEEDAVGALLLDNLSHEVCVHRLEIHLVGNALRGLDGCDVGVHQHTLDALLAQGFQGLRARVVKFTCLSDFQCTRA